MPRMRLSCEDNIAFMTDFDDATFKLIVPKPAATTKGGRDV